MQTEDYRRFKPDRYPSNAGIPSRNGKRSTRFDRGRSMPTAKGIQPEKQDGLGTLLFAPTTALSKAVYWITSPNGGGKLLFKCMASYCFLLSVEAAYVAMPQVLHLSAPMEERHFLPKPGVNDGADFSRIIDPVALFNWTSDLALQWVPFYQKHAGNGVHYVWLDQYFYFALLASALLHGVEAKAIRGMSLSLLQKRAKKMNAFKQVKADADSITIAKLAAKKYNHARVGNSALNALLILAVFGIELAAFFAATDKSKYPVQWVFYAYALLNSVGFEVFYNLSLDEEDELNTDAA